jgi:hypothetical protein
MAVAILPLFSETIRGSQSSCGLQGIRSSLAELQAATRGDLEPESIAAISLVLERAAEVARVTGRLEFRGLAEHDGSTPSATLVEADGGHYGLHVDDGARLAIDALASGPMRLSVNIGDIARLFLFVNLGVDQMLDGIGRAGERSVFRAGLADEIGRSFLAAYPEYPIVALRVDPGEAYLAPTQAILHDGAGTGGRIARHLSFSGDIALRTA